MVCCNAIEMLREIKKSDSSTRLSLSSHTPHMPPSALGMRSGHPAPGRLHEAQKLLGQRVPGVLTSHDLNPFGHQRGAPLRRVEQVVDRLFEFPRIAGKSHELLADRLYLPHRRANHRPLRTRVLEEFEWASGFPDCGLMKGNKTDIHGGNVVEHTVMRHGTRENDVPESFLRHCLADRGKFSASSHQEKGHFLEGTRRRQDHSEVHEILKCPEVSDNGRAIVRTEFLSVPPGRLLQAHAIRHHNRLLTP